MSSKAKSRSTTSKQPSTTGRGSRTRSSSTKPPKSTPEKEISPDGRKFIAANNKYGRKMARPVPATESEYTPEEVAEANGDVSDEDMPTLLPMGLPPKRVRTTEEDKRSEKEDQPASKRVRSIAPEEDDDELEEGEIREDSADGIVPRGVAKLLPKASDARKTKEAEELKEFDTAQAGEDDEKRRNTFGILWERGDISTASVTADELDYLRDPENWYFRRIIPKKAIDEVSARYA